MCLRELILDLRGMILGLKGLSFGLERTEYGPDSADLGLEKADFGPNRGVGGTERWIDRRTDGQTDRHLEIHPCVLQYIGHCPESIQKRSLTHFSTRAHRTIGCFT